MQLTPAMARKAGGGLLILFLVKGLVWLALLGAAAAGAGAL